MREDDMRGDPRPADDEMAALLALDALPEHEQADAELRHGLFPDDLVNTVALLAEPTREDPPADLRQRALARALTRRPAGAPSSPPPPCTAFEAYETTAAEFGDLLASLDPEDWDAPAHAEHGTVHDLVAHLTGVERLCQAWLDPAAPRPDDPSVDHITATRPTVDELAGTQPSELIEIWRAAATGVVEVARRGDPGRRTSFHDLSSTVDGLLVMRTFELWAHGMDIAYATGRPMPTLDASRMALLSQHLMDALPLALAYRRAAAPGQTARFVLTGPAGGTYTVPLAPRGEVGEPDVTIIADAVDLCRVAARRLPPADLVHAVEGDRELAAAVLAHVDAFARD